MRKQHDSLKVNSEKTENLKVIVRKQHDNLNVNSEKIEKLKVNSEKTE